MPDFLRTRGEARPDFDEANFLAALVETLGAPPDRPLLPIAVQTLKLALRAAEVSRFGGRVSIIASRVNELSSKLTPGPRDLPLLLAGRTSLYPVWSAFVSIEARQSNAALRLIGSEFLLSFLEGRRFRASIVSMARSIPADPTEVAARQQRFIGRLDRAMAQAAAATNRGIPPSELLLNRRIEAALSVQKQVRDPALRKCVGGGRILLPEQAREIGDALHRKILAGDLESLAVSIAFALGLPQEIALDVRFRHMACPDHVAAIDVEAGRVIVRLDGLLNDLAKLEGVSIDRQFDLLRPLPIDHSKLLAAACRRNPTANCLRDLLGKDDRYRRPKRHVEAGGSLLSVASFLASRGAVALSAGVDRHVAAYAVGAFSLVGNARLHYLTVQAAEIQEACKKVYGWLGWGEASSTVSNPRPIGSAVAPSQAAIRRIDQLLRARTDAMRVGKRTKVDSLLKFHNAYTRLCAHRAVLLSMARASRHYGFNAAAWSPRMPYGTLRDKAAGPWAGETPLPIPNVLATQIAYWHAHLAALDRRLAVLGWGEEVLARRKIGRVLRCIDGPLFFSIQGADAVEVPGSKELFESVELLKDDAYRHFISNELRRLGVPGQFIDAASRHTVPHASVYSITSNVSTYHWLAHCAAALDQIAQDLGIHPQPGLVGGRQ